MTGQTRLSSDDVIQMLKLQPLPVEGGYFLQTYSAESRVPRAQLDSNNPLDRPLSTAIYYLRTADPDSFSALHHLPTDEIYHHYLGDPVEMLLLHPDGKGEVIVFGSDLRAGHRPQVVVPAGVWQGGRVLPGGAWNLCGTTMAPGFDSSDYVGGEREALIALYPAYTDLIRLLTRPGSAIRMNE